MDCPLFSKHVTYDVMGIISIFLTKLGAGLRMRETGTRDHYVFSAGENIQYAVAPYSDVYIQTGGRFVLNGVLEPCRPFCHGPPPRYSP